LSGESTSRNISTLYFPAVVKKEGASRGILVTTSTYGADAYAFANNEPVTLLNGAELLGLFKEARIQFPHQSPGGAKIESYQPAPGQKFPKFLILPHAGVTRLPARLPARSPKRPDSSPTPEVRQSPQRA
jgi:hypothetical protein